MSQTSKFQIETLENGEVSVTRQAFAISPTEMLYMGSMMLGFGLMTGAIFALGEMGTRHLVKIIKEKQDKK
jgi:hypothetical protein